MRKTILYQALVSLVTLCVCIPAVPLSAWDCPCARDCDEGFGIFGSAEFLWWNVCHSDDLLIGVTDTTLTTGAATRITSGTTETFKFHYKPGFRVNLAYNLPCTDWFIGASYTYFHFHIDKTVSAPPGGTLWASNFPVTPGLINAAALDAFATTTIKYDVIDLVAAYVASCDGITGGVYAGLRYLIFDEKFTTNYRFNELGGILEPGTARWHVYMPAGGLTAGWDGIYKICGGWGLRGRLGCSALGARAKHRQQWTFTEIGTVTTTLVGSNNTRHCQVIWGWDAAVGINYDTFWCCLPVNIAIGYEVYDWWNMPRQRYFPSSTYPGVSTTDETGRFTVHGAYVRLGAWF
jgi:hypothetical protein